MLSTNTAERFGGIARLYGEAALKRFTEAHVCIIGIGGVGSWTAEAIARSGVGAITMVDLDDICVTNINRQLHAMDGQIGKQKTDAMADRIRAINPECKVTCEQRFYNIKNAEDILAPGFDFIIDAIDLSYAKTHLISECKKRNIPVVACGGTGGLKDPTKIQIADMSRVFNDGLLKKVRNELRAHYNFPKCGPNSKIKKFGVECIFSSESPVFPTCDGGTSPRRDEKTESRLNCSAGYGSITHMTATVGLFAAERCLQQLANSVV